MSTKLTDETIISFGVHKGKKLANIPAGYLLYLYYNNKCNLALRAYIQDNLESLHIEQANSNKFLSK